MYSREEILKNYKNTDFPKSLFDDSVLNNKDTLFYKNSKPPMSSMTKDISALSQSYVLPWRILQQKNIHPNNNPNNKIEFVRGGNFTPNIPKEPTIDIKTENFKFIYDKYSIPMDKKIIYLKSKFNNNILGPFDFEELQNMYKNKKYDSNYEFRIIDLFSYSEEEELFSFYPLKNINEDNWTEEVVDSPLLEYTNLFKKVEELLDGTKKRKNEIKELNEEIDKLKLKNEEKDELINELMKKNDLLKKELLNQKKEKELLSSNEKVEDGKEDNKDEPIEIEIEEKVVYKTNKEGNEDEKEIVEEEEKIEIKPKILDMGGEWEVAGKKKKKVEKVQEDPKKIVGLPSKGDIKNNTDSLIKMPGSNKGKKNQISGEELVDLLKPKKKEVPKNDGELSNSEFKEVKPKGKKKNKNKKNFENTDVSLGFKY